MSAIPGYKNRLIVDQKEITQTLSELAFTSAKEQLDDSVLKKDKEFISGQIMRTVTGSGRWTGDVDEAEDVIKEAIGQENSHVALGIGGQAWKMGTVVSTAHDVDGGTGSRVGVAGGWTFSARDFFSGRHLGDLDITGPGVTNGIVVDLGAARPEKARQIRILILDASAVRPSGNVALRTGNTPGNVNTGVGPGHEPFTAQQVADSIANKRPLELSIDGALSRYVRVRVTTAGAATTIRMVVAAALS